MKKILFVFALMLAFCVNASAQENKNVGQETAKKEAYELAEYLGLTDTQTQDFYRLFEMKYQTLQDVNYSAERRTEFLKVVDLKIKATLTDDQMKKLELNTDLYNRLKNGIQSK